MERTEPPPQGIAGGYSPATEGGEQRTPLFRTEALAAVNDLRLGRPVALMPVSWKIITLLLALLAAAAAIFLGGATYSRKETARGLLRPVGGDLRVTARTNGVVRALFVSEGELVAQGTPLAVVSTARTLESGAVADEEMLNALGHEEETLRQRIAALEASAPYDENVIAAQIAGLAAERRAARAARGTNGERLRIAEERLELGRKLETQGFIAGDEMRRRQEAVILQRQAGEDARAQEIALSAKIAELQARRAQRPHTLVQERGQLEASLAALVQRRAQLEAERGHALRAPVSGRVTALQAAVGQTVSPERPLMTITPPHARLIAELYVSSRAIGFVSRGQRVRLLYDSFPYERFGPAYGRVEAVSASVLSPREVQAVIELDEPVYRVVAQLDRQTIDAFGRPTDLQAGMALTADIILEKRSFAEWLFEPILAMRGRM